MDAGDPRTSARLTRGARAEVSAAVAFLTRLRAAASTGGASAMTSGGAAFGLVGAVLGVAAHLSAEPGHRAILDDLHLLPLLDLDLRLGEGSGAVLSFALVDAACALRDEIATFASASVSGPVA